MIVNKKYLLGQELMRRQMITESQLEEGIKYQEDKSVKLGRALMELNFITEKDLLSVLADQLGIKYVNISELEITPDLLGMISSEIAQQFHIFPVAYSNDVLTICVTDPLNINMMYDVQKIISKKIIPAISAADDIKAAIKKYY